MKVAFISDIHGNAVAFDAVLSDLKNKKVDKVYVLGDLCYRGPEPKRSLELVRSLNTAVIKGNADEWVVRGVAQGEVPDVALEMMNKERDWIVSQLDDGDIQYLSELPTELNLTIEDLNLHAFHATPNSLFDVVLPFEADEVLEKKLMFKKDADIYIYAHIHRPYIRHINGKCIINLGSVGLPFDGTKMASYAMVEVNEGTFQTSIVRVKFDTEKVIQQYKDSGYPNSEMMSKVIKNAKI